MEHLAQIVVGLGIIRGQPHRLAEHLQRLGILPGLKKGGTAKVQGVKMIGIGIQYLAIETHRLVQAARLMMGKGPLQEGIH